MISPTLRHRFRTTSSHSCSLASILRIHTGRLPSTQELSTHNSTANSSVARIRSTMALKGLGKCSLRFIRFIIGPNIVTNSIANSTGANRGVRYCRKK